MKFIKPSSPFQKLPNSEAITIDTTGKVLVIPSGNSSINPRFNEYTLDPNRLTIAESPFGGLKGSGSPDYAPGTLNVVQGDGVYLTDTSGTNSTKTLTAGKLKELSLLSVDTVAHSITEEFIVRNDSASDNPFTVDDCSSAANWTGSSYSGSPTITSVNNKIHVVGNSNSGGLFIVKKSTFSVSPNGYYFFKVTINSSINATAYIAIFGSAGNNGVDFYNKPGTSVTANTDKTFIIAFKAPASTSANSNPMEYIGTPNWNNNIVEIRIGLSGCGDSTAVTIDISNIQLDTYKSAYIELLTTNALAATSSIIQCYSSSAYAECRRDSLDGTYSNISSTPANMKMLDGTKFDDVYGSGLGRAYFPKGIAAQTVIGSSGTMTYSSNAGTRHRIGIMVQLPPSDGGRTAFNQCRLKVTIYYSDLNYASNILPDVSGNGNNGVMTRVGLTADNLGNPYKAINFPGILNTYIDIGNPLSLQITGELTICTTIKSSVLPGSNSQGLVSKYRSQTGYSNQRGYSLVVAPSGYISGNVSKTGSFSEGVSASSATTSINYIDGNWHRIVMIFKPSVSLKIYVDGVERASNTTNIMSEIYNTPASLWLGAQFDNSSTSFYYTGLQADTRIYSRAWLTSEVTADYNNQPVSSTGLVASWSPKTVSHMGAAQFDFADSNNASYGLQNMSKAWIALYDPTSNLIDFYLFTYRPKNLSYKRDESGNIYELTLYPGNGLIYHGQIQYPNLILDSNSNLIPNVLESSVEGSVTKFLQNYGMVI